MNKKSKSLATARAFAIQRHGEQRYGSQPYSTHLDAVAFIASAFGEQASVIAYLHDVVEDTATTVDDIENGFGQFIASCVGILTDELGENRNQRKALSYAKLAKVKGPEQLALVVKACDRLANLRACLINKNHKLMTMYRSEHSAFKNSVYRPNLCDKLWQEIDAIIASET